jgi:hypothetical protein
MGRRARLDELTLRFIRRSLRLRGRFLAALFAVALAYGWITPAKELPDHAALISLLASFAALVWAASDRASGVMRPILAGPFSRRAWAVSISVSASLIAGSACFACSVGHGLRPALGAFLFGLAYGWMAAGLGICLLILSDHPQETLWIGAALLALIVLSAPLPNPLRPGSGAEWHPLALYKYGLHQLLLSPGESVYPSRLGMGWEGFFLLTFLSLSGWRWSLRALERMESLPLEP